MQGIPVYLCKAYRTLGLTHFLALNWSKWSGPLIHPVSFQISSGAPPFHGFSFLQAAYHGGSGVWHAGTLGRFAAAMER